MAQLIGLNIAKAHLRIGDSECDDALLQTQLDMAIAIASDFTNRDLTTEYGSTALPGAIQAAILLILGTLYDNESDQIVGRTVSQLSITAEKLLMLHRKSPLECDDV